MRKKQNFIVWALPLIVIFLLLNIFTPLSSSIKNSVLSFTFSTQRAMLHSGNDLFKSIEVFQNAKEIKEEIEKLRKENRSLLVNLTEMEEIREENNVLREALNIDFLEEKNLIFSEVIGKDLRTHQILVRHEKAVMEGDPVVTPEGILIGIIEEVHQNFSQVRLITSPESVFEVKVQSEDAPIGVLRGTGERTLFLDLLPKDKKIERGDSVVGLPREGAAMKGIYIGRVREIEDSDVEAFMQAKVSQGIDVRYIDYLFVVGEES